MTESDENRARLLRALGEAISLLKNMKVDLQALEPVEPEMCTKLLEEFRRLSAAVKQYQTGAQGTLREGQPRERKPDYKHWARVSSWTADQAVELACGLEPGKVFWEDLLNEPPSLYEWLRTAIERGSLRERFTPAAFLRWVDALDDKSVMLPEELRQEIANAAQHHSIDFAHGDTEPPKPTLPPLSPEFDPDSLAEDKEDETFRLTADPRSLRTAQKLLAYFVHSTGIVDLHSDKIVELAQAEAIAAKMVPVRPTGRTVKRHLNDALITAREHLRGGRRRN